MKSIYAGIKSALLAGAVALSTLAFAENSVSAQTNSNASATLIQTMGPTFRGNASGGNNHWPFVVYDINLGKNGNFDAKLKWPTLNTIHKIDGIFLNGVIFFQEVEYIQKGDALIGCEFRVDVTRPVKGQAEGKWGHCTGNRASGSVVFFVPIRNDQDDAMAADHKEVVKRVAALADYVQAGNCPGLGVDHGALANFIEKSGLTSNEIEQSATYKTMVNSLIPQDVAAHGRDQFCNNVQIQFYQPGNEIHKIVYKE